MKEILRSLFNWNVLNISTGKKNAKNSEPMETTILFLIRKRGNIIDLGNLELLEILKKDIKTSSRGAIGREMTLPVREFLIIGKILIPTINNVGHVERLDILLQLAQRKARKTSGSIWLNLSYLMLMSKNLISCII